LKIGDEIEAVVLTLDRDDRKMSLGIKQLTEDPWTKQDLINKYAVNTKHTGTVRNMTNFGIFLELEEGIDGLVHVSDLSWTKKIKHPSDFVKVGDALEVMVLELDGENRRLALSHKHLEENPWDTFEHIFTVGSDQECTIISKNDKQATLELPYGIEGYALLKHLAKADGTVGEVGEKLTFQVLEFHKEEKKIMLSHAKTWEVVKEEAPKEAKKKGGKEASTTSTSNNNEEKSTLGDLSALSALKDAMVEGEKKKLSKKKDAPVETAAVETAAVDAAPVATETVTEVAPAVDATPATDAPAEA
jgi:small subunit ribosomal protein S1